MRCPKAAAATALVNTVSFSQALAKIANMAALDQLFANGKRDLISSTERRGMTKTKTQAFKQSLVLQFKSCVCCVISHGFIDC